MFEDFFVSPHWCGEILPKREFAEKSLLEIMVKDNVDPKACSLALIRLFWPGKVSKDRQIVVRNFLTSTISRGATSSWQVVLFVPQIRLRRILKNHHFS